MVAYSYLSNLAQSIRICWNSFYSIEAQAIKFRKSSHATFKMDDCNDSHTPTCMFDNKTNLLPSTPHGSARPIRCLEIPAKALQTSSKLILFRRNGQHMESYPSCHISEIGKLRDLLDEEFRIFFSNFIQL
jgi:hypothetical protein